MPHKTLEGRKAWYNNNLPRERARARAQYAKHGLTEAQRARHKITQAIWAANNPDKMALYYSRHYEKNKEKKKRQNHEYYMNHREQRLADGIAWRKANPERARCNDKRNKLLNSAKRKEQKLQWELAHPEQYKAQRRRSYLRRKSKIMVSDRARKVLALSKTPKCSVCGIDDLDVLVVHHIIPKEVGGLDTAENKTILCVNHHCEEHARLRVLKGHGNGAMSRKHLGELRDCVVCGNKAGPANHVHHLIWRRWGGSNRKENLFSFCGNCHAKVHQITRRLLWGTVGWQDILLQHRPIPSLLTI